MVEATVPKLVGLQAPAALEALAAAGLTGKTTGVFSDKPKNEVVGQDPAATTKVKKGSVVALEVSKGKQQVPVPDVVGQDAAAAIETVKAQGFQVNVVRVPSSEPAGQVVAQAPPAGKDAPGDSTVRLNVSDGAGGATTPPTPTPATTPTPKPKAKPEPKPAAPASVTVPDLRGLKLLAARKAIRKAGLVTEFKQVPSTEPKGTVVSQSPKPGETRKPGDHVLLNVSRGPKPTQARSRRRPRRHRRGPGDGKARPRAGRLQGRGRRAGHDATPPRTASCSTRTRSRADPRPRNRQ